jgi:hypothetical protein
MSAAQPTRDHRRFRLATNDNETIVDTETIAEGEFDTEAHRLATNDNETTVEGLRRLAPEDSDGEKGPLGVRQR